MALFYTESGAAQEQEQDKQDGDGHADQPEENPAQFARLTGAVHFCFHKVTAVEGWLTALSPITSHADGKTASWLSQWTATR